MSGQLDPKRADHLIDGVSRPPAGGAYGPLFDPSDGTQRGEVARGTPDDARSAVDSAAVVEERWAYTPGHERARVLRDLSARLRSDKEALARLICTEVGKPIRDARVEVERAVGVFSMAAEEIRQLTGQTYPADAYAIPPGNEKRLLFTVREPVGLVVAISPFNFPLNLLSHKVAPALAAGNPVIAKPASVAPMTALRLAQLALDAGLPAGVFNVVLGSGPDVGFPLVEHDRTRLVTFTGSTSVGRSIAEAAGRGAKRVILEMGGMDPLIVFRDASLSDAVEAATRGAFGYSGQVCTATKRIFVEQSIAEEFGRAFVSRVQHLKVGPALDESTEVGPLVDRESLSRIETMVSDARDRGARTLTGGTPLGGSGAGNFFTPTVLDQVPEDARVVREEPFGPLAPIQQFSTEQEAIRLARRTIYGLQAAVYTRDLGRAFRVARALPVGGVHINDPTNLRWDALPFGGVRMSGLGREGLASALREMTDEKTISVNFGSGP